MVTIRPHRLSVRTSGFSGEAGPGSAGHPYKTMYYVYVLQSLKCKRLYIGVTDNLEQRIAQHNSGKTKSNRAFIPFKLIHSECSQNKRDALKRERQIKNSGKIRKELKEGNYTAPSSIG